MHLSLYYVDMLTSKTVIRIVVKKETATIFNKFIFYKFLIFLNWIFY